MCRTAAMLSGWRNLCRLFMGPRTRDKTQAQLGSFLPSYRLPRYKVVDVRFPVGGRRFELVASNYCERDK